MSVSIRTAPPWLATVLLAEDDTEEGVMGSDLHQEAINESHATVFEYAESLPEDDPSWYVSSQVTVIAILPERDRPWQPKPDMFVVQGVPAHSRTSYDSRSEGPMPRFVLEVASESTWRYDVGEKARLYELTGVREYLVFDPAAEFLREQVRGWRRGEAGWGRWPPVTRADGTRIWESSVLGLAMRPEGLLLRFDHPVRGTLPVRREIRLRLAQEQAARMAAEERAEREQANWLAAVEREQVARLTTEARAKREQVNRLAAEERLTQEHADRLAAEVRAARAEAQALGMREDLEALRAEIARLHARQQDT